MDKNSAENKKWYLYILLVFFVGIGIGGVVVFFVKKNTNSQCSTENVVSANNEQTVENVKTVIADAPVLQNAEKNTKLPVNEQEMPESNANIADVESIVTAKKQIDTISNQDVAQDELIFVKNVSLPEKNIEDTVKAALLINDKSPKNSTLRVEFWISPLNYSGYRMDNFKLILFGVKEPEKAVFQFQEKELYLTYKGQQFILQQTEYFVPLNIKRTKL